MVDDRMLYMYERDARNHSFYSEGEYFHSWTEEPCEKCIKEYVLLPDGKGGSVKMEITYDRKYDEGAVNADYFGERVKMRVADQGGAAAVQVMPKMELATEVVQTSQYYFAEQDALNGSWKIKEESTGAVYAVVQKLEMQDELFTVQVYPSAGTVTLIEDFIVSERVPGRLAIRVGNDAAGYNYSLRSDGRFEFSDGIQTFLSDRVSGKPSVRLADGRQYFIVYNEETQELVLGEQHEVSVPAGFGKLTIKNKTLAYTINADGTVSFQDGLQSYESEGQIDIVPAAKRPVQYKQAAQAGDPTMNYALGAPGTLGGATAAYGEIVWETRSNTRKPYVVDYDPATGSLRIQEKQLAAEPHDYIEIRGFSRKLSDLAAAYQPF
jgi:hypothetical protein